MFSQLSGMGAMTTEEMLDAFLGGAIGGVEVTNINPSDLGGGNFGGQIFRIGGSQPQSSPTTLPPCQSPGVAGSALALGSIVAYAYIGQSYGGDIGAAVGSLVGPEGIPPGYEIGKLAGFGVGAGYGAYKYQQFSSQFCQ